jgi:uncharacterized membrane protein
MIWLRSLMLVAVIVWLGGIIFFAFVVAPAAFAVLPTPDVAGRLVGRSLTTLHWVGLIAGIVFLLCSLLYNRIMSGTPRIFSTAHWLIAAMILLTAVSQFGITPAIRRSRANAAHGEIAAGESSELTPAREFDRLHAWSVRLEGGVLVLGLGLVAVMARRRNGF